MSPAYEYECSSCDHKEIRNYSITGAQKVMTCPQCGEHALTKLIGRGYMFKMDGPGFFKPGTSASNIK